MKTLNNLFGKKTEVKNISDFAKFVIGVNEMNSVKGGTEPIGASQLLPPPPPEK